MISSTAIWASAIVLGAGTFAFRFAGPALRSRFAIPTRVVDLMSTAAVVLLVALVATSTVADGQNLVADPARPLGVVVGGVLAWRRAPFVVVVLAAGATAALLRLVL